MGGSVNGTRKFGCGVAALASAVWLAAGCTGQASLAERREVLAREHRERMERLERIEARLLGAEAKRAEWTELRTRHGRVTELACENVSEHVEAMVKHEEKQRDKRRKQRERRVAAATPVREGSAAVTASDVPPPQDRAGEDASR